MVWIAYDRAADAGLYPPTFLTSLFLKDQFGVNTQIYAFIPFINMMFTYRIETSYFRFAQNTERERLYNTLSISLIVSSIILSSLLILGAAPVGCDARSPGRADLIVMASGILF